MANYRLYHLDDGGKIERAEWLSAESDSEAERQARESAIHSTLEVWDRDRLVARIGPDKP
ncbi:MAG TPA: hypothetical protein VF067_02035 [Sphingomicrobium sp.]